MTAATALFVAALPTAPGFDASGPPVRSTCLQQGDSVYKLDALGDGDRVRTFYDYYDSEAHTGLEQEDTSQILLWDGPGGLSLVLLHDQPSSGDWGATGGEALLNISNVPDEARWAVQDDPGDFDRRNPPLYEWSWNAEHTDGGALRDVADHFEAGERIQIIPLQWYDIGSWKGVNGSAGAPVRFGLNLHENVTVGPCETRLEADPVVEDADGEAPDPASVSATLTNDATGEPIPGAEVRFEAPTADGPRPLCRAETNATGVAACGLASSQARTVASLGYEAVYRGTTLHAPARDAGPVVEAAGEPVPPGPADDAADRPDTRALAPAQGPGPAHPAFAEAGRTTVADAAWSEAGISAPLGPSPLVLATTQTENGDQDPSVAHVRGVGPDAFETQHCEHETWDTCDTSHIAEENGWIALRPDGVEDAPGMETGTVVLGGNDQVRVTLPHPWNATPLVFATVQTENGSQPPRTVKALNRTSTAFTLEFCEWDGPSFETCDSHATETVAWWAVDPAAPRGEVLDWGEVAVTNSTWRNVSFDQDFQGPPVVHATVQTENGTEEVPVPEVRNVTAEGAQVRYCEAQGDACDDHPEEVVAWVALAPGALDYPGPSPPRNVTADPGPGLAQAAVSWDPPRGDGGFDRTGYHVYRARADRNLTFAQADRVATVPPDATWAVDDAAPGRPYDYWVTAVNEASWESAPSHPDCTRAFPSLAILAGPLCPGPD